MKIDYGKFATAQNNLVKGPVVDRREFLKNFLDSDSKSFRKIFSSWGLEKEVEFSLPKENWEGDVFQARPFPDDLEEIIKMFAQVQPCDLSRPATWYAIHIKLVEEEVVDQFAFVGGSKGGKGGYNSVKQALDSEEKSEKCLRNILRHMGGILSIRGSRSTFLDCPTGSFYWKCRFSLETIETYKMERRSVYDALSQSSVWEPLIEGIVSRMTIIGDSKIRPALIAYIAKALEEKRIKKDVKRWVRELRSEIGQISITRHLGFLETQEIMNVFQEELGNQLD